MSTASRPVSVLSSTRTVPIDDRGSTQVWNSGSVDAHGRGEPDPVVLLHGWNVDARLNFDTALPRLCEQRRVIMFDQHGHGLGVRTRQRFDLYACADDTVAVLDQLGIEKATVLGYSLGGAVAQILARRHPERCSGLVLAATADRFSETPAERTQFAILANGARAMRRLPERPRDTIFHRISALACRRYPSWVLDTVRQADPIALLEAGAALGAFDSTEWAVTIDTPTAVVVTSADTVVDPARQRRLARQLGTPHVVEIDADHDIPIRDDARFAEALVAAVDAVAAPVGGRSLG